MYWIYRNHQAIRSFNTQKQAVEYAQKSQAQENIEYPNPGKWTVNYQGSDISIEVQNGTI